jgi:polyisoprenoid-binding protein YceI
LAVPVAGLIAFVIAYLVLLTGSAPAPLSLASPPASRTPALAAAEIPGTWTVASGSVAGYRVREQLAFLSAPSDAVGRTSAISGSVTIAGAQTLSVTAAQFSVDVSMLRSDRSTRDERIHEMGLESDRYPTASFVLDSPITLPADAASGRQITVNAGGRLTIHGTSKAVSIPLHARLNGSSLEVQGSLTFRFEDFGMTPPNIAGIVSVQDSATLEFDLHLTRS